MVYSPSVLQIFIMASKEGIEFLNIIFNNDNNRIYRVLSPFSPRRPPWRRRCGRRRRLKRRTLRRAAVGAAVAAWVRSAGGGAQGRAGPSKRSPSPQAGRVGRGNRAPGSLRHRLEQPALGPVDARGQRQEPPRPPGGGLRGLVHVARLQLPARHALPLPPLTPRQFAARSGGAGWNPHRGRLRTFQFASHRPLTGT